MDKRLLKKFGLKCKQLRGDISLSQESFANRIEMDRSYYASIEAGRRNVTLLNMKKIADGFNISLSELLEDVE